MIPTHGSVQGVFQLSRVGLGCGEAGRVESEWVRIISTFRGSGPVTAPGPDQTRPGPTRPDPTRPDPRSLTRTVDSLGNNRQGFLARGVIDNLSLTRPLTV